MPLFRYYVGTVIQFEIFNELLRDTANHEETNLWYAFHVFPKQNGRVRMHTIRLP